MIFQQGFEPKTRETYTMLSAYLVPTYLGLPAIFSHLSNGSMVNRFNQSLGGSEQPVTLIPVIYYSKLQMSVDKLLFKMTP